MDTINSSSEIDMLFRTGKRSRRSTMIALGADTPAGKGEAGRVVYVAGKRLGGAVWRNRSKRGLRAAVQRTGESWPLRDVALIATDRTASARAVDVDDDLRRAIADVCA